MLPVWIPSKTIPPHAEVHTVDARELSNELTALESEVYLRITREECVKLAETGRATGALWEAAKTHPMACFWAFLMCFTIVRK